MSRPHRAMPPLAKVIYLLALSVLLFVFREPTVIVALLGVQILLWFGSALGLQALLWVVKRLALFFIIIFLSYAFISTGAPERDVWISLPIGGWQLEINQGGLLLALLMCLRVATLVIASAWVQRSCQPGAFVKALVALKIPSFLALSIDSSLHLISGDVPAKRGGGGGQGGGRKKKKKLSIAFAQIRRGELSFLTEMIDGALGRAEKRITAANASLSARESRDIAIIVAITAVIMALKMVQLLPGLPIAPGHKNLLIIPLFLLASQMTHTRFGGLWTGLTVGVVSFMLGYGKYGLLEIAQFAVPGLMADLLLPLVVTRTRWLRLIQFAMVGALLGLGRFTANVLVIILAGAPEVAFVLFLPMLLSQVIFGAASGMASVVLLAVTARQGRPPE